MKYNRAFMIVLYVYMLTMFLPWCFIGTTDAKWAEKLWIGVTAMAVGSVSVLIVCIIGIIRGYKLYKKADYISLRKSMTVLKLGSIPFYVINFLYSVFVCMALTIGTRGVGIVTVPLAVCFTYGIIIMSGIYGILYIKYLRKVLPEENRPSILHYIFQFVSVFDVVSTLVLIAGYKNYEKDI